MALRTALATALLVILAGCGDDPSPVADDPADRSSGEQRQRDKQRAGDDPSGSESAGTDNASTTVAVYYVGDTERAGPRLYREFRRLPGEDALTTAVNAALGTGPDGGPLAPLDPDYRSAWPSLVTAETSQQGGTVTIDLGGDPESDLRDRPPGMSADEARAAVQQLVYTAQAAVQSREPVQLRLSGEPTDRVLGVPTTRPVSNGSMLEVLSHVNLTTPEEGAPIEQDQLEVSGVGNSFEANLGWELRQGDRVVEDGFTTMSGWMGDKLFPFEFTVDVADLEPGDYTLWVTTDDPTGGTEGVGAMTDDKVFTIR
jgi:hypothetical protein